MVAVDAVLEIYSQRTALLYTPGSIMESRDLENPEIEEDLFRWKGIVFCWSKRGEDQRKVRDVMTTWYVGYDG